MDDIIEALRKHPTTVCAACDVWGKCGYNERCECICHKTETLLEDAADEIERLRREIEQLHQINHIIDTAKRNNQEGNHDR